MRRKMKMKMKMKQEEDDKDHEDDDFFWSFQPLLALIKSGTSMDCVEALKGLQARDDGEGGVVPIFLR